MEARLSSTALKNPSGKTLLVLLACLVIGLAFVFDTISGQLPGAGINLLLPLGFSALASGVLGYGVVPFLQKLKTGQIIQEDGPQTHLKKAGTPTMGGVFFVPVALVIALVWSRFAPDAIATAFVSLAYGGIGWLDDWQVLRLRSNKGISPRMKLIAQIAVAVLFCAWLAFSQFDVTTVVLPGNVTLPLGLLFCPLAGFVLVAQTNATNLTDGVDGLAAGTGALSLFGLAAIIASTSPDLALLCACLSGGCLGFVVHNRNPATVFMGDTGSLALGGALAAVGIISNSLWGLLIVSGIFLVESLSVIAQVSYYKATKGADGQGKRLLKMAPLHHHLELSGWSETQIVGVFYLVNAVLAVCAVASSLI